MRIALWLAVTCVLAPRSASACPTLPRIAPTPADRATDVPTNVEIRTQAFHHAPYLEDAHGARIEATTTIERRVLLGPSVRYAIFALRPHRALRPDHDYALVYDQPEVHLQARLWFHTATGPDRTAPGPVVLRDPRITLVHRVPNPAGKSTGDRDVYVTTDLGVTRAPSYVVSPDGGAPMVLLADELRHLGELLETRGIHEACLRIAARDLAGNIGPATRACVPIVEQLGAPPAPPLRATNVRAQRPRHVPVGALVLATLLAVAWALRRRRHILL